MHVVVVGAGVGGLCLAHGLHRRGVEVTVLERDNTSQSRSQGLRLRIDAQGRAALAYSLPGDLYDLAMATSNKLYMSRGVALDENLHEISSVSRAGREVDPVSASTVVNRRTLRQVLLADLEDVVRFGQEVTHYDELDERVAVHCADGTTVFGDVVVAADGINSVVRSQRLPQAGVTDTGLRAIYGQMRLDDATLEWLPDSLFGGSRPVLGPDRITVAFGVFQPRMPVPQAVSQFAPRARLDPVTDYLKWTLVAPVECLDIDDATLFAQTPQELHRLATELTSDWSPVVGRIMAETEVERVFPLSIRASDQPPEWRPSRVTVLGDAIHATTPVGGTGANTALRDAALLAEQLTTAGDDVVVEAIAVYENEMRRYGIEAVTNSLWGAERIFRSRRLVSR